MSEWKGEQKICSECGGVIRFYTTTGYVEGVPKDVQAINAFDLFPPSRRCTGHHEPQANHGGTLDEDGTRVFYDAL